MEKFGVMCMVLFGIVVSLQSANGIECYECGFSDNRCKDTFDKNAGVSKIPCEGLCTKGKNKSSGAVIRGCLPGVASQNKCEDQTIDGVKVKVCMCSGNLCNGVLKMGGSFVVMMSSIVIYLGLF
uniref:Efetin n=1 Tax=Sinohyriopsis cumingii TaxID=165450 RepID=A0A2D1QTY0_SINCU|nr:Efetin [Sinohyriopsis cumingii]